MRKKIFQILIGIIVTIVVLFLGSIFFSWSCHRMARYAGSTLNITLKPGEKCQNITWKESSVWVVLTKKDEPGVTYFREYSPTGVLNGEVVVTETPK
jgi:hypothetical protein